MFTLRVLGIDPGSRYLGYGVIDFQARQATYVAHGVVKSGDGALPERLRFIHQELARAVALYKPQVVAVEGVFHHKNARSALILGHARGIALLIAAQAGLEVFEYAPARVKKSVGAGGNDGKEAVARMVRTLLKLTVPLERSDASDALAVALCHGAVARAALPASSTRRPQADFGARLKPAYVAAREAAT